MHIDGAFFMAGPIGRAELLVMPDAPDIDFDTERAVIIPRAVDLS
jgi:hypothetical protein